MSKKQAKSVGVKDVAAAAGLIDPDQAEGDAAEASAVADAKPLPDIEIQIDPEMLQRAVANRNARLIAVLVNENAMLEVALEQERRVTNELRTKIAALQALIDELSGA